MIRTRDLDGVLARPVLDDGSASSESLLLSTDPRLEVAPAARFRFSIAISILRCILNPAIGS